MYSAPFRCRMAQSPSQSTGTGWCQFGRNHYVTELRLCVESKHFIQTLHGLVRSVQSLRTETGPHGLCCLIECIKIEHNQRLDLQSSDYQVTFSAQLTTLPNGLSSQLCYLGNNHLLPTIYRGVLLHIGCDPK